MLKKINYVLDRKQKINLGILLVIIFIGAFVELLGVSAVMPLINVAMQPETIGEKWYFVLISRNYRGKPDDFISGCAPDYHLYSEKYLRDGDV